MKTRRELLKLAGAGGVVFASGLLDGCSLPGLGAPSARDDFFFVQLSDTHWGYKGPANPEAQVELPRAVALVNALPSPPDFVVFTGDLTHTTDDDQERRRRMAEFRDHIARLRAPVVRLMAGEHDASLDRGKAFEELFGPLRYSFEHKGIHFVVLDNVSDPKGALGDAQIDWLAKDLAPLPKDAPIVVFTHRPLFDLAAAWDWTTADGSRAIEVLHAWRHVTVFYGHIHQEHHHKTDHIAHHAARSLIFPLPAPFSQPKRAPVQWDPAHPGRGLGFRDVDADPLQAAYQLREIPLAQEKTEWPPG
jgi:calcineurin-like phosphoesterase family protein